MSHRDRVTRRRVLAAGGAAVSGSVLASLVGRSGQAKGVNQTFAQTRERTTVEIVDIADGDTVDIEYSDGTEETIRVLGVDTTEKSRFARFERPEEWEGLAYDPEWGTLDRLTVDSTCSLYADDGTPLTDEAVIAVWAEPTAVTENQDFEEPTVAYDGDTKIPLVAAGENVVGFGAILMHGSQDIGFNNNRFDDNENPFDEGDSFEEDRSGPYGNDHEQFVLNIWDTHVDRGDVVLWDEGHGQYYTLDLPEDYVVPGEDEIDSDVPDEKIVSQDRVNLVEKFVPYAERSGYELVGVDDIAESLDEFELDNNRDVGAIVITSPEGGYTAQEVEAIQSFIDDGGAVFLHDQSDYQNFDGTGALNGLARSLGLPFRWNDDQVIDEERNLGDDDDIPFIPWTNELNTETFPRFFRDRIGINGGTVSRTTPHLEEWADRATTFAQERLDGETVDIAFDDTGVRRDQFGRVLAYVYYDATGDGSRDTLFNRELIEEGYARLYSSDFDRFHEFQSLEQQVRDSGTGLWAESDVSSAPSYRNRPVEELFFPNPVGIGTINRPLAQGAAPVFAHESASWEGETGDEGEIPLVGVDPGNQLAAVGANLIEESYELTEESSPSLDMGSYENFVFLTNLADALSEREGEIQIDGGHGQFGSSAGSSAEDTAYYQRFLEGQQRRFRQVTDLEQLDGPVLIVAAPPDPFSRDELARLSEYRDNGGAIILLGAAGGDAVGNLNAVAAELRSDLRLSQLPVTDSNNSRNRNPALVEVNSRQFNNDFDGLFRKYGNGASMPTVDRLQIEKEESNPLGTVGDGGENATTNNSTNSSGDGIGPGFGVPGAVAGLGGLGYLLKRRLTGDPETPE